MGVQTLWKILEEVEEGCSLPDLCGTVQAIDLSGWVYECSFAGVGKEGVKMRNPHLRYA